MFDQTQLKVKELSIKLANVSKDFMDYSKMIDTFLEKLEPKLDSMRTDINDLKSKFNDRESKIESIRSISTDSRSRLGKLDSQISLISRDIEEIKKQQLSDMKGNVNGGVSGQQLNSIKEELHELVKKSTKMESDVKRFEQKLESVGRSTSSNTDTTKIDVAISKLQNEQRDLTRQQQEMRDFLKKIQSFAEDSNDNSFVKNEIGSLKTQIETIYSKITLLQQEQQSQFKQMNYPLHHHQHDNSLRTSYTESSPKQQEKPVNNLKIVPEDVHSNEEQQPPVSFKDRVLEDEQDDESFSEEEEELEKNVFLGPHSVAFKDSDYAKVGGDTLHLKKFSDDLRNKVIESQVDQDLKSINSIKISNSSLTDEDVNNISKFIKINKNLTELQIADNKNVSLNGLLTLLRAVRANSSIKKLRLSGFNFNNKEVEDELSQLIKVNDTLESLDISNNSINQNFVAMLCKAVPLNNKLRSLNLRANPSIQPSQFNQLKKTISVFQSKLKVRS
eukprot:TRINITY_DN7602_c0_g1_i1.p1 TRINITY_DN7602_c0_g1~~TRINITY_DN7602_c0_g1_i1.p1  ORF type:complete len:547 (+),score=160.72 TRINITY_DN7602_c0_g1_i1:134-1642(+)